MGSPDFWHQIRDFYHKGIYCDMELLPGDSKIGLKCHQLVLASVSKAIRSSLRSALKSNDSDPVYITLPEFGHDALHTFLNTVYDQLVKDTSSDNFVADSSLEQSLDLRVLPGAKAWTREDVMDMAIEHQFKPDPYPSNGQSQTEGVHVKVEPCNEGSAPGKSHDETANLERNEMDQDFPSTDLNFIKDTDYEENEEDEDFTLPPVGGGEEDDWIDDDEERPIKRAKRDFGSSARVGRKKKKKTGSWSKPRYMPKVKKRDAIQSGSKVDGQDLCTSLKTGDLISNIYFDEDIPKSFRSYDIITKKIETMNYRALFGIVTEPSTDGAAQVIGRPLAWCDPSLEELTNTYENCMKALKHVHGYSYANLYVDHANLLIDLVQGRADKGPYRQHKSYFRNKVKDQLNQLSDSEIMLEIDSTEVQLANATGRPNPGDGINDIHNGFSMKVDHNLDIRRMDAMLIIWQTENGLLESKFTTGTDGEGPPPLKLTYILKAIWCNHNSNLPPAEILDFKCKEVLRKSCVPKLADEIFEARSSGREKICPVCGMAFKIVTVKEMCAFNRHVRMHKQENEDPDEPKTCNVCHKTFENKNQLLKHENLVHKKGYTKCPKCHMVVKEKTLKAHDEKFHGDYICDTCGAVFKNKSNYDSHMSSHREGECPHCHMKIIGRYNLKKHINVVHLKIVKDPVKCPQCPKEVMNNYKLKLHILSQHTPEEGKPFHCPTCGKGFVLKDKMNQHILSVHTNEKPYICKFGCGYACADRANWHKHMRHSHRNETLPPPPPDSY